LNLLLQIIRLEQFDRQDMQILGMFDSLVDLLCRLLYSKHDTVVTLSIRCFSSLLKQDLPQMIKLYPVIIKQCFQIISTNRARDSPLMQNMFKFIVTVIRDKKDVTITNKQLGALLSLLKLDLEEADRHTTSFSLIKAIVSRKMVIEELYDVMDSVALLMVTSHIPQIRELARFTFVQFLIDYPQGEQRLKKQIQYVLKNMNYEFETGRISILETVLLLSKFYC
jgi:U3 small nucleolar RNA-associated protein 20